MNKLFSLLLFCGLTSTMGFGQVLITSTGASNQFNVNFPANVGTNPNPGMSMTFFSNQSISGAAQINVNSTGNRNIIKNGNAPLAPGDVVIGQPITIVYDGANWHMISPTANSSSSQWINATNAGIYYPNYVAVGGQPSGTYQFEVNGRVKSAGINETSDLRYKKDLIRLSPVLDKAIRLNGYSYAWRTEEFPEKNFEKRRQIGLIAQEVEREFPELVMTDAQGFKSVEYSKVVAVLLEALKEQQLQIERLNHEVNKINELENKVQVLNRMIETIARQQQMVETRK